jgi:hypothetical protein
MPKGKEPPPKADVLRPPTPLPPPKRTADQHPKGPRPILFPAPPYPPPAPTVVDPRTGAWEQFHTPLEAGPEVTGPVEVSGPVHRNPWSRAPMALRHWFYRFNHSGEGANTIDRSSDERSSQWDSDGVMPGY